MTWLKKLVHPFVLVGSIVVLVVLALWYSSKATLKKKLERRQARKDADQQARKSMVDNSKVDRALEKAQEAIDASPSDSADAFMRWARERSAANEDDRAID